VILSGHSPPVTNEATSKLDEYLKDINWIKIMLYSRMKKNLKKLKKKNFFISINI
jgi:uncharacterized C2H2 Zn-finger protein